MCGEQGPGMEPALPLMTDLPDVRLPPRRGTDSTGGCHSQQGLCNKPAQRSVTRIIYIFTFLKLLWDVWAQWRLLLGNAKHVPSAEEFLKGCPGGPPLESHLPSGRHPSDPH